jgi:hypothetical protein
LMRIRSGNYGGKNSKKHLTIADTCSRWFSQGGSTAASLS